MSSEPPDEIRFYRANEPYGFLSNLYRCPVILDGQRFRSAEDAYQFAKPIDPRVAAWLISAPSPSLCTQAAHALLPWQVRADWSRFKLERMRAVLRAKFAQNAELLEQLLSTGDAHLVEASRTDSFWGVGRRGNGQNMLGVLLMELRDRLRGEIALTGAGAVEAQSRTSRFVAGAR